MDSTAAAEALFWLPTGVTTDGNGRVVVTDAFKYQIIVLDGETGEKVAEYGDFGTADGLFNNPSAIAYDAERDYFVVADTDNNRLQVVRIEGSSNSAITAAFKRLFDRPVWICCLPFLILLIAAIVVWFTRRRGKREGTRRPLRTLSLKPRSKVTIGVAASPKRRDGVSFAVRMAVCDWPR